MFAVAGSQTEAMSGKGGKYVTLPSVRSCATASLNPSITGRGKRAKKIRQITFFVNNEAVRKVRTPKKGQAVALPIADGVVGEVSAKVRLFPARKGRPGKVQMVSAAYEACSVR